MLLLDFPPLEGSFRRSWLVLLPSLPGHEGGRGCWFGLCEATAIWPQSLPPLPSSHPPSSSSATGARVRVPHKPHTGPRHNPGATSAQGLIMTLFTQMTNAKTTTVANTKIRNKTNTKAHIKPCCHPLPFMQRTFMTTQKVLR